MTFGQQHDEAEVITGPEIDGQPTTISIFSTEQLKRSHFLPSLLKTINLAYRESEKEKLGRPMNDRLGSIDDLIASLRDDPESFIVVISQPQRYEEAVATGTCRRYHGPGPDSQRIWSCNHIPEQGTEEWELKLLATHPDAQGKGLASFLLNFMEKQVAQRFQAKHQAAERSPTVPALAKMILCTPKQQYGDYYARRGYDEMYLKSGADIGRQFDITFKSKTIVQI